LPGRCAVPSERQPSLQHLVAPGPQTRDRRQDLDVRLHADRSEPACPSAG